MARDLIRIFDQLNDHHFDGAVCAGIGWRKWKLGEKQLTLGSCSTEERFIRINAVLQNKEVPLWFLKEVVYHEMIHALQGPKEDPHDSEFQEVLERYPDYLRAKEFELTQLPKIVARLRNSS